MLCHPHMECACTPNAHNPCKLDTQRVRGHFKCTVERVCSLSSEEAHRMQVHLLRTHKVHKNGNVHKVCTKGVCTYPIKCTTGAVGTLAHSDDCITTT